ncbi:hypothetical protein Nmel_018697 [Mimus melanotis]
MPMDEFWIPLLATLLLLHQTTSASDPTELNRAVGESVTFHIHYTTGGNAFWNFGNDPIVTASFQDPPQALFSDDKFKKRFSVSEKGRALSISQLRLEDSGNYSVTIGGKRSNFTLHVYNELAEPTVTCEAQNCSAGICHFSLRCSTSGTGRGKVSYSWRVGDRPWGEGSVVVLVNKSSSEEEEPLTCTARNPISSRNVTVTTPDVLCTETFTHLPGPGALSSSGIRTGLIAGVGVVVLSLALVSLLLIFSKSRGWKKFPLSKSKPTDTGGILGQFPALFPAATSENTTLYAEVGPSQQNPFSPQRVSNGIKAKATDGESATTIYSLVKHPEQVDGGAVENGTVIGLELV